MIRLPERTVQPLTRETVLSLGAQRVQKPLDRRNVADLNRGKPVPGGQERAPGRPQESGVPAARPAQPPAAPPVREMRMPPLVHPLMKGQRFPLESAGKLSKVNVCMGWNVRSGACDADVSAFFLQGGKVPGDDWFVFYGQEESPDRSAAFSAEAAPDRERISIDLSRLDPRIDRIVFILTIQDALQNRLNFSMLKDVYLRLTDADSGRELASFPVGEYYDNIVSMMVGELYRHNGAWKFSAVGNGVEKDLAGLCGLYGVQVE